MSAWSRWVAISAAVETATLAVCEYCRRWRVYRWASRRQKWMSSDRGLCSSASAATTTSITVKATSGGSPSFLEAGSRSQAIPFSAASSLG
jgi:hypothetical protein